MASQKLRRYFAEYASFHQTPGNQLTHYFGIPMIVLGLLGVLAQLVLIPAPIADYAWFQVDAGLLLWVGAGVWYLTLDQKVVPFYLLLILSMYALARTWSTPLHLGLFFGGWVIQFVGHVRFEKKKPAFTDNLLHLLIGPLWIFSKMIGHRSGH